MRSSAGNTVIRCLIPDVHDHAWADLMTNALAHAVQTRVADQGTDAVGSRPAERISAFNNYI